MLGQILILRKDFKPVQLLQLPLSFLFGNFIDFCVSFVSSATVDSYPIKIVGAREGTLIVSLCTGSVVRFFNKFITKPLNKILTK